MIKGFRHACGGWETRGGQRQGDMTGFYSELGSAAAGKELQSLHGALTEWHKVPILLRGSRCTSALIPASAPALHSRRARTPPHRTSANTARRRWGWLRSASASVVTTNSLVDAVLTNRSICTLYGDRHRMSFQCAHRRRYANHASHTSPYSRIIPMAQSRSDERCCHLPQRHFRTCT